MKAILKKIKYSLTLWISCVWYLIVSSRSVSSWMNLGARPTADLNADVGSPIDRAVYIFFILIGMFVLIRRKLNWKNLIEKNIWVLILLYYIGISLLWSDYGDIALKGYIKVLGSLIVTFIVLTEDNPLATITTLLRTCYFVYIPMSIIFIRYFPNWGVDWSFGGSQMWIGITYHKNTLGEVMMVAIIFFIWDILRSWPNKKRTIINLLFTLMALYLLIGPRTANSLASNTAMIVLIFGLFILFTIRITRSNPKYLSKLIVIAVCSYVGIFAITELSIGFTELIEASGRDTTFTGRTDLWTDILEIAPSNPILGVGYASFWIGDISHNLWDIYSFRPNQGHNGYLDIYVQLGIVGLFLMLCFIFITYRNIFKTFIHNFDYSSLRIVLFLMILLHNITESSFLRGTHNLWFIFLLVTLNTPINNNIFNNK